LSGLRFSVYTPEGAGTAPDAEPPGLPPPFVHPRAPAPDPFRSMSHRIDVRLEATPHQAYAPEPAEREERSFRLLVLGDFSGRTSRTAHRSTLPELRPLSVDRDDLDGVIARMAPSLALRVSDADAALELRLTSLDDLHPDRIFATAPVFGELRELRRRASDPAAWRRVAAELRGDQAPPPPPPRASAAATSGAVLDLILDEVEPMPEGTPDRPRALQEDELQAYVRGIVAPHLVANPDPRQVDVLRSLDAAVTRQMRTLLHHPDFQALDSLWRSIDLLVRRVETSPRLRVDLVDVTLDEIRGDAARFAAGDSSGLRDLLLRRSAAGDPWSLVVANWSLGQSDADIELLAVLAALGREAGAPCIAGADPSLSGIHDLHADDLDSPARMPSEDWASLRRLPEASYLALALPRFLVRLPYGEEDEPCDDLEFEEFDGPPAHEEYLWANGAFVCAILLAGSFSQSGWEMRPGELRDLDRLPLHLRRLDGAAETQPCAEIAMTEDLAERLLDAGLVPLASIRDRDLVRIVRFQSIADPPAPIAGPWAALF
jgi:type VI secretion system protein ImpC